MKVNKMIGKAMAATVAATVMLGGATVMADEYFPVVPPLNAQEAENHTPGQTILRDESKNELERMIQEILDQAAQDATTPDEEESVPVFVLEEDTTPVQKPAEIDEPEAEYTIETLGLTEEDEETDESPFHTGDILHITDEPTTLPAGVYRIYYTERDYSTFTAGSFYVHNGKLIMKRGGISIAVGSGFRGLRIIVTDSGAVELHPVTQDQIDAYEYVEPETLEIIEIPEETPDKPNNPRIQEDPDLIVIYETPVIPENPQPNTVPETATPINYSVPVSPDPVFTISEESSAPATLVAGAARTGAEGFVDRLYVNALNRNADESGRAYWINLLTSKAKSGTQVANGFFGSLEFTNRNLSNEQFVKTLYKVFFDREPDQAGLETWVNALNNGTSRSQVIAGFTASTEWTTTCNAYGIDA